MEKPRTSSISLSPELQLFSGAEKSAIVLELGSKYLKAGFAGEVCPQFMAPLTATPRCLLPATYWQYIRGGVEPLREAVERVLRTVYFKYLQSNPRERRVVLTASLYFSRLVQEAFAFVLFTRFMAPTLQILVSEPLPLLALGQLTAIVVDVGQTETRILPIYEGIALTAAYQSPAIGMQSALERISDHLKSSHPSVRFDDRVVEDIASRFAYTLPREGKLSTNEKSIPVEALNVAEAFYPPSDDEDEEEGRSIASAFLLALQQCPVDTRVELCRSILVVGGASMLPGFATRFLQEVRLASQTPVFEPCKGLTDAFQLAQTTYKSNILLWIGGAVAGALEPTDAIARDYYTANNAALPDWTSLKSTESVF